MARDAKYADECRRKPGNVEWLRVRRIANVKIRNLTDTTGIEMFSRAILVGAVSAVVTLLAGCGGGGGSDSEPTIGLTFTPSPIVASVLTGGNSVSVAIRANVTNPPSVAVFGALIADRAIVQTGPLTVTQAATGIYTGTINLATTLPAGVYNGSFTLKLCKDSACANEYPVSGNNLPYTITVLPQLALTSTLNGGTPSTATVVAVRSGDTVSLLSNTPVTWIPSTFGATATVTSQTTTTWTARLAATSGFTVRTVVVSAQPATAGTTPRNITFNVSP